MNHDMGWAKCSHVYSPCSVIKQSSASSASTDMQPALQCIQRLFLGWKSQRPSSSLEHMNTMSNAQSPEPHCTRLLKIANFKDRPWCPTLSKWQHQHGMQESWSWEKVELQKGSKQPAPRDFASMLALDGNRLLLFAGLDSADRRLDDVWLFDETK